MVRDGLFGSSDGEALGPARCPAPTQRGREVVSGAAEALEDLFVGNGAALLDVGAGQGQALRMRRTRTERADSN